MFDCNDIIVNAPSIRYLAGYLGIACPADTVWLVEVCKFPGSIPAMLLAGLAKEVCQAYSGTSHSLTVESLAGRVKMLTSWRSFHLDNELKQCSSSCILSVDDDNPLVALYALERSRYLGNPYQAAFMVVLALEVLARLVKQCHDLRFEFEDLLPIIFNNSYCDAACHLMARVTESRDMAEMKRNILHDVDNALRS